MSTASHPTVEQRLLRAAVESAATLGYQRMTVGGLLADSRVSRASFYQHFRSLDECFLEVWRSSAAQLLQALKRTLPGAPSSSHAILETLLAFAAEHPGAARVLLRESLTAGPEMIRERERLIAQITELVATATPGGSPVDLPAGLLIGGLFRLLAGRLELDEPLAVLGGELARLLWLFAHDGPRWSTRFAPRLRRARLHEPPDVGLLAGSGAVRGRILAATAETVVQHGYRAATIEAIAGRAGVSRRTFYNEFPTKADAYIGVYEWTFQEAMACCAPAFFNAEAWPDRVWSVGVALTGYIARYPSRAYLGVVECHALGDAFASRILDTQLAFTWFLEQGYRQDANSQGLPRTCSELVQAIIFEAAFVACRSGAAMNARSMLPLTVFIALAPYIGAEPAGTFVERNLRSLGPRRL